MQISSGCFERLNDLNCGGQLMACFTVPLAEAVILTVSKKILLKRNADKILDEANSAKIESIKAKLGTLEKMLYGGSFLLAVEHFYHGELSFVPPFLTAMKNPAEIPEMLKEMATVGIGMALLVTAVWGLGIALSSFIKRIRKNKLNFSAGLA